MLRDQPRDATVEAVTTSPPAAAYPETYQEPSEQPPGLPGRNRSADRPVRITSIRRRSRSTSIGRCCRPTRRCSARWRRPGRPGPDANVGDSTSSPAGPGRRGTRSRSRTPELAPLRRRGSAASSSERSGSASSPTSGRSMRWTARAASLAIICRHYGKAVSLARIRQLSHTSLDGTSLRPSAGPPTNWD